MCATSRSSRRTSTSRRRRCRSTRRSPASRPTTLAILEERREAFRARRDFLVPALRDARLRDPGDADGGFFVYADCSRVLATTAARSAATCSKRRGVAFTPGHRLRQPPGAASTCASPTRSAARSSRTASSGWRATLSPIARRTILRHNGVTPTAVGSNRVMLASAACCRGAAAVATRQRPPTTTGRASSGQARL